MNNFKPFTEKQDEERHELIGLSTSDTHLGGCERFKDLHVSNLEKLIEKKYIDLTERQNDAPDVQTFYNFMKDHSEFLAHGYIISNRRDDRRISIEGLEYVGANPTEKGIIAEDWLNELTVEPDEFIIDGNSVWLWWD